MGSSADDPRKWVVAIALGKPVLVDIGPGPIERFRLQFALGRAHDMWFTQKFVSRHPELAKITSAIAKGDGSKWRVWRTAPSISGAQGIDSSAGFVRWLRSMMARGCGRVWGGRCVPRRRRKAPCGEVRRGRGWTRPWGG